MPSISAVIFSKNSIRTIEDCVRSVAFCDEIVVIDMGGSDGSGERVAKSVNAIYHLPSDFVEQVRNAGVNKSGGEHLLILDADEEVSNTLADHIIQMRDAKTMPQVVRLPRINMMFGKKMGHAGWWPDYQMRLYKRGTVVWQNVIHAPPQSTVAPVDLPAEDGYALIHHHIQTVDDYLTRIVQFTKAEVAREVFDPKLSPALLMGDEFFKRYYFMKGYKEGSVGLHVSLLQAIYQYVTYLRRWEAAGFPDSREGTTKALLQVEKNLHYWQADRRYHEAHFWLTKYWWRLRRKWRI